MYADSLGWWPETKEEAGSLVSREIFRFEIEEVWLNLAFYYVDNDTFYGIHSERYPIECKILPRDKTRSEYPIFQCNCNTHEDGEVIASFDDERDIWDNLKIDGHSLEEVLERSFIIGLY